MPESVFSKIYSYRERENKDSKENFLIEIFAHCLDTDEKFCTDFLNEIGLQTEESLSIKTQTTYEFGRPDIEINFPKTCILIECKIEHFERLNQLNDYKKILKEKNVSNCHLVYLTKYYDHRDNDDNLINLHLLKWSDIYQLIDEENTEISQELKAYLKDENMENTKNFNYTDLMVLKDVAGTIGKMNEVIDGVKEYYEKKIGRFSKESSRSTLLEENGYFAYHVVGNGQKYRFSIFIGFIWWWEEPATVGITIMLPKTDKLKNSGTYYKMFKNNLKGWKLNNYQEEDYYYFEKYKLVGQIIIDDEEQIPAMIKFLIECTDDLDTLKKVNPRIFK